MFSIFLLTYIVWTPLIYKVLCKKRNSNTYTGNNITNIVTFSYYHKQIGTEK